MLNIAELPKYESYKQSGPDWLGEIPADWKVRRLKFLFKEINERSESGREALLSVSQYTGVTPKSERLADGDLITNAESLEGYKIVRKDDLVSNIMLAWNGSLGFSSYDGIVSPAYSIYRLQGENSHGYFHYLLRTEIYKAEYKRKSTGVIESRLRLYSDDFYDVWGLVPSEDEQKLIAKFLDKKTTQIDEAIAIKEQQIALLKERKKIIIQKAVTQGLDPTVPMKDSGVDWIGEIPAHWEVENSRWIFKQRKMRARKTDEQLTASQKYGVVPQKEFMETEGRRVTQVEFNAEILKHVEKNDFVISMRSFQGGIEYCPYTGCVSSAYVPLIPGPMVNPEFFKYLLKSPRYIEALQSTSNLVRDGQALRYENFCMVPLPVVSVGEQAKIACYIEKQIEMGDRSIRLMEKQIEKLKEYKTTLINSAVTGKIRITPGMVED